MATTEMTTENTIKKLSAISSNKTKSEGATQSVDGAPLGVKIGGVTGLGGTAALGVLFVKMCPAATERQIQAIRDAFEKCQRAEKAYETTKTDKAKAKTQFEKAKKNYETRVKNLTGQKDIGALAYDEIKKILPETLAENARKLEAEAKSIRDACYAEFRVKFGEVLDHVDSSGKVIYDYYWATEAYVRRQKEILGDQKEFKDASRAYIEGLEDRIKAYDDFYESVKKLNITVLSSDDASFLDKYRENAGTLATEGRNLEVQKAELSKARLRKGRIENWREFPKLDDALIKELGVEFDSSVASWDNLRTQAVEEREKIAKSVLEDMERKSPGTVPDVLKKATLTGDLLDRVDKLPREYRDFATKYREALLKTPGYKKYSMLAAVAEEAKKQNVPFSNWGDAIKAFNNPRDKAPRVTLEQAGKTVTELEEKVAKTKKAFDDAEKFITSKEVEDRFKKVLKECGKSEREIPTLKYGAEQAKKLEKLKDAYNKALDKATTDLTQEQNDELVRLEKDYNQKRIEMSKKHSVGKAMHDEAQNFLEGQSAKLSEADKKWKEADEALARISNEPVRAAMEEEFKKDFNDLCDTAKTESKDIGKKVREMSKKYNLTGDDRHSLEKLAKAARDGAAKPEELATGLARYNGKNYIKLTTIGLVTVGVAYLTAYSVYELLKPDLMAPINGAPENQGVDASGLNEQEKELFDKENQKKVERAITALLGTNKDGKHHIEDERLRAFLEDVKREKDCETVPVSSFEIAARQILIDYDTQLQTKMKEGQKKGGRRPKRSLQTYQDKATISLLDTLSQFTLQEGLAYKDTKDRNIS